MFVRKKELSITIFVVREPF